MDTLRKIIVASHGSLAQELINTSRMFTDYEDLTALGIETGDDLQKFKEKMYAEIFEKPYEEVLLLVDLLGGTPFNTAVQIVHGYTGNKKIEILTGANLPMLLEVLLTPKETSMNELKKVAAEAGRQGIKDFFYEMNKKDEGR
jgi:mannose/fructose/sorbose-specific phosphotransferase system IIA component